MPASNATNASLTPLPGHLYVVATPIGNLADLTDRARAILGNVDAVACEDTRMTGLLLSRLGLKRELLPYHDHNEVAAADHIAAQIAAGRSIALVSDAGTPALSDPGFRLVRACRKLNLPVIPVPGPCAITTALSAAGLPTDGFLFVGFLTPKSAARIAFLNKYRDFEYTVAVYESCHRIEKFAKEIVAELGPDRVICIAKEITKIHETFHVGSAADVRDRLLRGSLKGEFVVLIAPARFSL
jgi:16S rRNA (cytidine1402-2'-O)-methyltransferase